MGRGRAAGDEGAACTRGQAANAPQPAAAANKQARVAAGRGARESPEGDWVTGRGGAWGGEAAAAEDGGGGGATGWRCVGPGRPGRAGSVAVVDQQEGGGTAVAKRGGGGVVGGAEGPDPLRCHLPGAQPSFAGRPSSGGDAGEAVGGGS
nr:keratin, type I cytoskeletal 9-like [Aegilops tauschii subsp. strangulata]